jgi:hypothetical protein
MCDLHLMDPGTCVLCDGHTPIPPLIDVMPEATFRARHGGYCLRCDRPIVAGQALGLYKNVWIHLTHFDGETAGK